jgi:hypothetical protein
MSLENEKKLKFEPGQPGDVALINRALDGDEAALLAILNSDTAMIIVEGSGDETIAGPGAVATRVQVVPSGKKE